jgi:4-hydroxybenzoate polyprenyltransferase
LRCAAVSEFERHIRKQRERKRDVRRADRAVTAYIVWVVVGVIALALALLINSTALVVVVGGVIAIAILWKLLARSQR